MKFIKKPVNDQSVLQRKPILGFGINDADYIVQPRVNGKQYKCPFYVRWKSMIERCYSKKLHEKYPTYKDCTVCSEWLLFSNFKSWMEGQDWKGKQLDKDLLIQGNKVYSPSTCIFINLDINLLLNTHKSVRGKYKLGVSLNKDRVRAFRATCNKLKGKIKTLGDYYSEDEAHQAYCKFKYSLISKLANKQKEPLKSALLNYKISEY